MKKKKHIKKNNKNTKKSVAEQNYENARKKRIEIENDINKTLDELSVEELTELEEMGDFSKEAIEWIRARKKRKKAKKEQEEFERRLKCSNEVIKRTELIGKIFGFKNGAYRPKSSLEAAQLKKELEQDFERGDREREKQQGDSRSSKGGAVNKDERQR